MRGLGIGSLSIVLFAMGCAAKGTPAGGVTLALMSPGGTAISNVEYTLRGPSGYRKMGTFSVAGPGTTFEHSLTGIPAGNGYQVELGASTDDGRPCRGRSAMFSVLRSQSVRIEVTLSCEGQDRAGSVVVNGGYNTCPVAEFAVAEPTTAQVDQTVELSGGGSDEDSGPEPLKYYWYTLSGVGQITERNGPNTTFRCTSSGVATIALTVSDGDPQCGGNNTTTLRVTCGSAVPTDCDVCTSPTGTCGQRLSECYNMPGQINGTPKSQLCSNILECMRTTACATDSSTDSPSDCFCGQDVDVGVCANTPLNQLTGECRDLIAAGAESTNPLDVSIRMGDPTYATGLAMRALQCQMRFCQNCPVDIDDSMPPNNFPPPPETGWGTSATECQACEQSNPTCAQRAMDCDTLTGEVAGVSKAQLCRDVISCVRSTHCVSDSATDSASDCFCGLNVDVGECSTKQLSQLTGECKGVIAQAAEADSVLDITTRLGDPEYAVGRAMRLILCDQRFCALTCGF